MSYIATIGVFDGVHKGHQFLINALCHEAEQRGLQPAVIVIDKPSSQRLTTRHEQAALLEQYTSHIIYYPFKEIQHLTAQEFMTVLHDKHNVSALMMGYDHRFGCDQLDYDNLKSKIKSLKSKIDLIPCLQGPNISSSKIRNALLAGDIESANFMLGYNYTLTGTVVHGNGIGRTIGFPTANIQVEPCKLIPKSGVYAATNALVNIGTNPTIGNDHLTIEAYLPNYHGSDFYGQQIQLPLTRRLRDEQHFPSLDALKAQIRQDLQQL